MQKEKDTLEKKRKQNKSRNKSIQITKIKKPSRQNRGQ